MSGANSYYFNQLLITRSYHYVVIIHIINCKVEDLRLINENYSCYILCIIIENLHQILKIIRLSKAQFHYPFFQSVHNSPLI